MNREEKIRLLQILIQGSASITEQNKVIMIQNVDQADEKEIDKAIAILEEEKEAWMELKKESDDHLKWIEDFAYNSSVKIQEQAKSLLQKKEQEESESDMKEMETLIDNL